MTGTDRFHWIFVFGIATALSVSPWPHVSAVKAAPSAWRDQMSGFAIGGYDPVAYHTHNKPSLGVEGLEHRWGGAVWQFISVGNRDVFAAHPQIYAPRFAGYDALALSKGLSVRGHPAIWAMYRARVYLFQDIESLRSWRRTQEKTTDLAQEKWKKLGEDLPGTSEW